MINRRQFLKLLLGTGACAVLPFDLQTASENTVSEVWERLVREPVVFDVSEGTVYAPWGEFPQTYGDVHDLSADFTERSELTAAYDGCFDLQSHFYNAFEDASSEDGSLAMQLYEKLDMDEGVVAWLQSAPLDELNSVIDTWLAADLPCCYEMPLQTGPMGEAYGFFLRQDASILESIGIVVVEGEHPGSSYFAAELRLPVVEANIAAEALDIPIRFREVA